MVKKEDGRQAPGLEGTDELSREMIEDLQRELAELRQELAKLRQEVDYHRERAPLIADLLLDVQVVIDGTKNSYTLTNNGGMLGETLFPGMGRENTNADLNRDLRTVLANAGTDPNQIRRLTVAIDALIREPKDGAGQRRLGIGDKIFDLGLNCSKTSSGYWVEITCLDVTEKVLKEVAKGYVESEALTSLLISTYLLKMVVPEPSNITTDQITRLEMATNILVQQVEDSRSTD